MADISWTDPDMPCLVYSKRLKAMQEFTPAAMQETAAKGMKTQQRGVMNWRKDPTYNLRKKVKGGEK